MSTTTRPVTIFIAEDNPVLLQGLDRALSAHGYAVETAKDGARVLERLSTAPAPPDLLLLDVMMPGMSGIEVMKAVQDDPRYSRLPVMLITAATGDTLPFALPEGDSVEVLIKPFRLSDLLSRINEQVQRARLNGSGPETTIVM